MFGTCKIDITLPWIWDQLGLELIQIHIESSTKPEGGSDTAHNLGDQTVEICVGGALHVQVTPADVVDGLVVNHEFTVRVLQGGVGAEGVIRFYHGGGHLGGMVDGELSLAFFLSLSMSKEMNPDPVPPQNE